MVVLALASSLSCSVAFQASVRSSSVYCSTSRFYYISDLLIAGTGTFLLANAGNGEALAYVGPGLFAGSALIGIIKRNHCVRLRETAPPEVWAAAAEAQRRQAEADAAARAQWQADQEAAAQQQAQQQQQQQQQPQEPTYDQTQQPTYQQPEPQQPTYQPPPPNVSVTIERHAATDELGKSCHAQPGWPAAAECQYGAVCYANECTVWCGNDGSCPSGYRCAFTDGNPSTKLCRR